MSKKTRKKSSRPSASKAARASAKSSKKPTKTQTKASRKPSAKSAKPATAPKPVTAGRSALTEGAKAPSFSLPSDADTAVSLRDYTGKKLVIFFYPRADTPGCTKEAIDFTRLSGAFSRAGTAVLGVSGDSPRAQEAFRNKHQLSVPLLSDEKHDMLRSYDAWGEKSMYGRTFEGIRRTTVLIGADGRIVKIWRNVRVEGHAEEVLAAARAE